MLSHPFHLHGYKFHLLKIGRFADERNISKSDINAVIHQHQRQIDSAEYFQPPGKDTVSVPHAGYVIFRFKADNPGICINHEYFKTLHFPRNPLTSLLIIKQPDCYLYIKSNSLAFKSSQAGGSFIATSSTIFQSGWMSSSTSVGMSTISPQCLRCFRLATATPRSQISTDKLVFWNPVIYFPFWKICREQEEHRSIIATLQETWSASIGIT